MGNKKKCFVKFDGGIGGGNTNFNSQLKSNESTTIGFSSFGLGTPVSNGSENNFLRFVEEDFDYRYW